MVLRPELKQGPHPGHFMRKILPTLTFVSVIWILSRLLDAPRLVANWTGEPRGFDFARYLQDLLVGGLIPVGLLWAAVWLWQRKKAV